MTRLKTLILLFFILVHNSPVISQQVTAKKNILILFSYSSDGPAYKKILYGITEELTNEFGDSYNLHTEYLQILQFPQGKYPKERFDLYNQKYQDIKLDLLICVGVSVIDPVKNFADSYLINLPTVSADLDFTNYGYTSDLRLNDRTAVIGLKFNIEKTLSTALSLFPASSSIYFISGTSYLDKFLMSVTKEASKKIDNNIQTTFDTDLSMDETLERVRNLPENTIIFVPYFTTDSKLVRYHNTEAVRLMSRETKAPIFHLSDLGIGDGSIGGYVMSFFKVGSLIGKAAVNILNGADPNSIKVTEKDYNEYQFDWRELKRWNLEDSDLIPEGSNILFKEITFWGEYKWIIITGLFFLFVQSLLIINLIRLYRNQKLMTRKIIDNENRFRGFLHEDRSLRLGQLAASLSHELNQPLTAILSTAQAGLNFIDSNNYSPELLKEILQKIVENDKRGASIISSIRGMMKLESREKGKINLNSLIGDVVTVYKGEATQKKNTVKVSLSDEPVYVSADGIQIQQVVLNLIFNASQSMEKVSHLNKVITISSLIINEDVIVSVRDNGTGIDEAIKGELFKSFITSRKEGMGIGLSICRSIIEDHGGKIWAENLPDGGANFLFSLKVIKDG